MTGNKLLKNVAEDAGSPPTRKPLGRYEWLAFALTLFVDEGIEAVRITKLATALKVSRGSFYWHFKDRDDLVRALVKFWREKNTRAIVNSVITVDSLEQGILNFFEITLDENMFDPRLDLAIREWARRDSRIRRDLDREDKTRIDALTGFFERCGFQQKQALIRARVLYFSQIGFYALGVQEDLSTRLTFTEDYFECFTGQQLSSLETQRFKRHIKKIYGGNGE